MTGRQLLKAQIKQKTQVDLAELTGISQETISRLASGESKPSLATAVVLWEKLQIPVESWK